MCADGSMLITREATAYTHAYLNHGGAGASELPSSLTRGFVAA